MERPYFLKTSPACNNNCIYCRHLGRKSDKFKPLKEISRELKTAQKLGFNSIRLSCNTDNRRDFIKILRLAKENAFNVILETNGRKFADKSFFPKVDPFVDQYEVYLNCFNSTLYQAISGSDNGYDEFQSGFHNIVKFCKNGKPLIVKFIYTKQNTKKIFYLTLLAILKLKRLGINQMKLIVPFRLKAVDECVSQLFFLLPAVIAIKEYARRERINILTGDCLEYNPYISQEAASNIFNTETAELKIEVKKYKNKPKFSIIIPTFNKKDNLGLVLNNFFRQDYPKSKYEIIVVDDGSNDRTFQSLKKLRPPCNFRYFYWPRKKVRVKDDFKKWAKFYNRAGLARNIGIKHAEGEIILFNDSDILPAKDCLKRHEKHHNRYSNIIVRAFRMQVPPDFNLAAEKAADFKLLDKIATPERIKEIRIQQCRMYNLSKEGWQKIITANLSIRKKHLELAGGFGDDFVFWGFEDVDLGYRLKKFKMKFLWDDKIKVYHLEHPREFGGKLNELMTFWLGMNILYRKYLDEEIFDIYSKVILLKLDDMLFN